MKKISVISLFAVIVVSSALAQLGPPKKYVMSELSKVPADTINAEMTRIWVPVEKYRAKMKIEIQDRRRRQVRTLFDDYVGEGYYNLYWDKKDNNGSFVAPGKYIYYSWVDDKVDKDSLVISYRDGEKEFSYDIFEDKSGFAYNITKDSTLVSLILKYKFGDTARIVFSDSLFQKGDYEFRFDENDRSSQYTIEAKVNSFLHLLEIRYRKKR